MLLLSGGNALAEVYKCRGDDGRISYGDLPCPDSATQSVTGITTAPPSAVGTTSAIMQQLDAAVQAAIAQNDLARAQALATTAEQKRWVSDALAQRAAQPAETGPAASEACRTAKRNLETAAQSDGTSPELLSARKSLMYVACGVPEPVVAPAAAPPPVLLYTDPYRFNRPGSGRYGKRPAAPSGSWRGNRRTY